MVYIISYDLNSPTKNREQVEKDIKSLGSWCKYVSTTFLVASSSSLDNVTKKCTSHLDGNDRMIICKVEKTIQGWLSQEEWNWIHKHL